VSDTSDFLQNPEVLRHYTLLQDLGVFRHFDELKKEGRDWEGLLTSATDIFRQTSTDQLLETAVRCISEKFLPSFLVFMWRAHPGRESLVVKGYRNFNACDIPINLESLAPFEEFFKKYPQPIGFDLFEYQFANPEQTEGIRDVGPEIVVPVLGPSGLYGLILIGPKVLDSQYAPRELSFLDRLMSFVSIALQNHLHYEHSVRDPKTGLFNHGFFMVRINEEVHRAQRRKRPFSVIVIDVDKFKSFNDTYGHLAGDRVLENMAEVLRGSMREGDILSRFGGEEFMVLLPETGRLQAWSIAERLRLAIESMDVHWNEEILRITISLGIAVSAASQDENADTIIQWADNALYQSKTRGRNCTSLWRGGLLFKSSILNA
jgi:diguanylate cyclase (GGDEF)-like protein